MRYPLAHRMRQASALGVFLWTINLWALPMAWAQSDDEIARQVEQLSDEATDYYAAKQYDKAIALFEQAYSLDPVPTLLFNIAKCHEKQQNWDQAIDFYELFIVEPDIGSEDRKAALERIETLREIKDTEEDLAELDDPEKQTTKEGDAADGGTVKEPASSGPSKVPGIVILGTGLAALGGGAYFGLQASAEERAFESSESASQKAEIRDRGRRQAAIADGLYAGGAILSVLGAVLLVRASRSTERAEISIDPEERSLFDRVHISPIFGASQGVRLEMSF